MAVQPSRPDVLWGKSRTGKTVNLGLACEYLNEKYQKPCRIVCAPGEGWENIDHLVKANALQPFMVSLEHRQFPLEDFMKLSMGWWPQDISDPKSKLLPPSQSGLDKVAGIFFEQMSSIGAALMTNTTQRMDIHIPETPKESFVKDGDKRWGFSGRAHYGWIQKRIEEWVKNSTHIPVPKKIWTSLETKGETEQKKPVYGPEVIGQAATGQCPAWFHIMVHLSFVQKQVEVPDPLVKGGKLQIIEARRLMFLKPHIEDNDPYRIECLADVRAPFGYDERVPVCMEPNLKKLYKLLDELQADAAKAAVSVPVGAAPA